jgi:hypothetical protein
LAMGNSVTDRRIRVRASIYAYYLSMALL